MRTDGRADPEKNARMDADGSSLFPFRYTQTKGLTDRPTHLHQNPSPSIKSKAGAGGGGEWKIHLNNYSEYYYYYLEKGQP